MESFKVLVRRMQFMFILQLTANTFSRVQFDFVHTVTLHVIVKFCWPSATAKSNFSLNTSYEVNGGHFT